jgi:hypothetical protein
MLIRACNNITKISEDPVINIENYMEGLGFISNLYNFLNYLKLSVPLKSVEFLPSFKGKYTVEKLGVSATDKENEMKVFKIQSSLFLEDKIQESIKDVMSSICEAILQEDDVLTFYLI